MLFHSYEFMLVFLPAAMAGYWFALKKGQRAAVAWLVFASIVFYSWWIPAYTPILVLSVAANYVIGTWVGRTRSGFTLGIGIAMNLALLFYFKYAAFLGGTVADLTGAPFSLEKVILPLGISFFTFQQIAYLVDVRQEKVVKHDWLHYALFVTFFPQLIAGPIVHQREILPQVIRGLRLRQINLAVGLTIFAIGLFKKVVIAETMAGYASPMFNAAALGVEITFFEAWGGVLAYAMQIYFDFSAYSDMAIGLARLFGIILPINFNAPYKATSIIDFWQRWHITLSRFLRDYLYFPLGGSRRGVARRYQNLLIVMILGGLWHGAAWTFVFWGTLHGLFLCINHFWRWITERVSVPQLAPPVLIRSFYWSITFLSITVAWVFFRAEGFDAALNILRGMAAFDGRLVVTIGYIPVFEHLSFLFGEAKLSSAPLLYFSGRDQVFWIVAALGFALVLPTTQQLLRKYRPTVEKIDTVSGVGRFIVWRPILVWAAYTTLLIALSMVMALQPTEFLYFQF